MSADIHVLPLVRVERDGGSMPVLLHLARRDFVRLNARAIEWNCTIEETAAMLLKDCLDPRRN